MLTDQLSVGAAEGDKLLLSLGRIRVLLVLTSGSSSSFLPTGSKNE